MTRQTGFSLEKSVQNWRQQWLLDTQNCPSADSSAHTAVFRTPAGGLGGKAVCRTALPPNAPAGAFPCTFPVGA